MKLLGVIAFIALSGLASADEVFFGSATRLEALPTDPCPEGELCLGSGWFTYSFTGESLETGEYADFTVARNTHTWYRVDAPWLVTLRPKSQFEGLDFLEADYLIVDIEVFSSHICTENVVLTSKVDPDIADETNALHCISERAIWEALSK